MLSGAYRSRRGLILAGAGALGAGLLSPLAAWPGAASGQGAPPLADYLTPFKLGRRVLEKSPDPDAFDSGFVDCPFVFAANGRFYMTYVGFDGRGYQTGIAESDDLVDWRRVAPILRRDAKNPVTRHNIAMTSIVRENELWSPGRLQKVGGRYLGAWHAYPHEGLEQGPAVIGLAWSDDLLHWEVGPPCLRSEDGAGWERGGLYKPYLVSADGGYYLFYNAKNRQTPWLEQTGVAMSRDLARWTRHPGNPLIRVGPKGAPDDRFASDPAVYRHNGQWALFYYGFSSDGHARELLALGPDPFHFEKAGGIVIDIGPPGAIDEDDANKASLIAHDGALYHFYGSVSGRAPDDNRAITVARSKPW
jgi:predicted GH43/DUF377 family glycosyl hydrolase